MKHLRYLRYLIRHKWFVFVAGLSTGAPLWRLIVHDWSKFLPSEWRPYADYFYGKRLDKPGPYAAAWTARQNDINYREACFDGAWLRHQHRNPHHWQHWVLREDSGSSKALRMPRALVREMVADWMGAGRAITGKWEVQAWYEKNRTIMQLHPDTRTQVVTIIAAMRRKGLA